MKKLLYAFLLCLGLSASAHAACSGSSPNLTAPTWADLAACHTAAANSGDTITITPDTYVITSNVATAITKHVTIVATGVTLTDNTSNVNTEILTITESTLGNTKLSGLTINAGSGIHLNTSGMIGLDYATDGKPILLTGNTFTTGSSGNVLYVRTTRGVIWLNTSIGAVSGEQCIGNSAFIRHKITGLGIDAWKQPSIWGNADTNGDQVLYVERNVLNHMREGIDWDDNARIVIRYNHFVNSSAIAHGVDTSGYIAARHSEQYGNVFEIDTQLWPACYDPDIMSDQPANLNGWSGDRGGSTRLWGNVVPHIWNFWWGEKSGLTVSYENLQRNEGGYPCWDTYAAPGAGYPGPHMPGWGYISGGTNPGGFGPGDTITGTGHVGSDVLQDLEPSYYFANTGDGNFATGGTNGGIGIAEYDTGGCGGSPPLVNDYVNKDREFYEQAGTGVEQTSNSSPFNGTTGTGYGTKVSPNYRPTTCTTGVAYWATDEGGDWKALNYDGTENMDDNDGMLYICTATNTWTASYTPYPFPHDLAGGEAPEDPTPLISVRMRVLR